MAVLDLNNLTEQLVNLDDVYDKIEVEDGFRKVKDGKYPARIEKVEFKESTTNKLMLKFTFVITDGEFLNSKLFRNNMLTTPENLSWLKKDLVKLGYDGKISDLPQRLHELLDLPVAITVANKPSTNGQDNVSVYIDKVLKDGALFPAQPTQKTNSANGYPREQQQEYTEDGTPIPF